MVRPKWENLPEDLEKQPAYIDRILTSCESPAVSSILKTYRRQRDLQFRSPNYRTEINMQLLHPRLAAAIQLHGEVMEEPCDSCGHEDAPYTECVRIPGEQYGCVLRELRPSVCTL